MERLNSFRLILFSFSWQTLMECGVGKIDRRRSPRAWRSRKITVKDGIKKGLTLISLWI
jgi:hypothetical protein